VSDSTSLTEEPNVLTVPCGSGEEDKPAYHYGSDYRELVRLPCGIDIVCRTVHPDDKRLLAEGMRRLSSASRHARFHSGTNSLSASELTYLTELDGVDHYAIGAVLPLPGGRESGIGIAKFVRFRHEPEVAEPAVTVIDDYQGCGVGTALLRRVVDAARERDVKRFRCEFLAENQRVSSILDEFQKHSIAHREQGVVTMEFPLPTFCPVENPWVTLKRSAIYRALARAAQGVLFLQCMHQPKANPNLTPSGEKTSVLHLEPVGSREKERWGDSNNDRSATKPALEADE
jgi:GNAT superfamily N-acetyltransferase